MKKLILLIAISLFSIESVNAQENETVELGPHHVGLHAGSSTGFGFSYRYWPGKWGLQVTGIPIFGQGSSYTSFGLSALFMLKDNERVDLFAYLGNHLIYRTNKISIWDPGTNTFEEFGTSSTVDNLGLGLGLRVALFDVINLNFQAGYGVIDITGSPYTFLSGEFGIYYQL